MYDPPQSIIPIDVGAVSVPKPGEEVCGDAFLVKRFDGTLLCAVIDGLGHGPSAFQASQAACEHIDAAADSHGDLAALMRSTDRAIRRTRGAAITMLVFDLEARTVTHAAVGNVRVLATSRDIRPLLTPGVVGTAYRTPRTRTFPVQPGDTVIAYTDGLAESFDFRQQLNHADAESVARALVADHSLQNDDATCLVVRL